MKMKINRHDSSDFSTDKFKQFKAKSKTIKKNAEENDRDSIKSISGSFTFFDGFLIS